MTQVVRFAPSPNGFLHLGHAYSALLNFELAGAGGGRFLLRIDDIDRSRCRPDYEAAIDRDLAWIGLSWERPVRRQSDHLDDYRKALARLEALGLVYPSFESRAELARRIASHERQAAPPWPRDPDGVPLYPGLAPTLPMGQRRQRMAGGAPYALRLDTAEATRRVGPLTWHDGGHGPAGETGIVAAAPAAWGDIVLARKDIPTSYHLSVVVDDAAQGVTDVVRGEDLFWATSLHRLLQALLELPQPRYRHHRLIRDAAGRKLAKSTQSTGLHELRAQGVTSAEIRHMIGMV